MNKYLFIYLSKNKNFFITLYLLIRLFLLQKTKKFLNYFKQKNLSVEQMNYYNDENYKFSNDFFSFNIPCLQNIFYELKIKNKNLNILEIGSFEGRSAIFFLKFFQKSNITCIDIFEGHEELKSKNFDLIFKNFDNNTKNFKDRIKVFRGSSDNFFLQNTDHLYDLIFIDGNHSYNYVLNDAINSFKRLKKNGIIIFDDFLWKYYEDINQNPIGAIKEFIKLFFFQIKIVSINYQIIIKKI